MLETYFPWPEREWTGLLLLSEIQRSDNPFINNKPRTAAAIFQHKTKSRKRNCLLLVLGECGALEAIFRRPLCPVSPGLGGVTACACSERLGRRAVTPLDSMPGKTSHLFLLCRYQLQGALRA